MAQRRGSLAAQTLLRAGAPRWPPDRASTQVDEVAAESAKGFEKAAFTEGRERIDEGLADGAVKSRIGLIEKPSGNRWRFADEKDADTARTVAPSQAFFRG